MDGRLELSLLGSPIVRVGDTPVTGFRSSKAAALLYYLAVTRRSHSRTALAAILWGDSSDELARRSLRSALFNLRQLVGSHLVITANEILFAHTSPYQLDVEIFEATTQPLTVAVGTEGLDVERLQQALGLYRGDFLEGFYVHNAPEFEQWVLAQRQRLREGVVTTYQAMATMYEGAGAWTQAIDCARHLLAVEPWHEEVHRQLMLLLANNGQRSAALAQYELCCRILAKELDVEADSATQELYERIRSGALAPAATLTATKQSIEIGHGLGQARLPNAPKPSKHNLPAQIIAFVGRRSELALLAQLLDQPSTRLVTILGLGGMGKTRMALEVAATQVDRHRHGVYYVPLAPLDDAHGLIQTIAGVVHCAFQADRRSPRQQLFEYLSHKEMLILLDNFEHLAEGAELLHELLQAAPGIRLLITSRERLRLSGETIFRLEGLDISTPQTTEMAGSAAAQLFLQSVRRIRPEFMPGAEEWQAIAEVCRLVQGMPLGIILAAAWSTTLSPTEIAAEIRHGLGFLESDLRDLPVRQRSMSAILTQTWARLDENEVAAFRRMAVFRGGFTRQAGLAVTGATLAMLATLLDKALLARNLKGRYDIHELLRQSAQQRLEAAGEIKQTCDAHSAYYLNMLHQYESDLKGGRQATALQELDADSENIRAAWQWAFNHDQLERLAPAVEELGRFYGARGRFREGEIACRQLAEKLSSVPEERHSLAKSLVWQAEFSHTLGRTDEAIRLLRQSLALLEGLATEGEAGEAGEEVRATKAAALSLLGLYLYFSDGAQGQRYLEESLALYRVTGNPYGTAKVLHMLANFDVMSGALVEAKQRSEDSKESCQMLGNYADMLEALLNLTEISIKLGDFDSAEHFAQEYYAAGEKIGHHEPIVYTPWVRGQARLFAGNFGEGQLLLEESLSMTQERGDFYHLSRVRLELAEVNVHLGAYTEAEALATSALHMADESDLTSRCADALCRLGEIRLAENANEEALRLLGKAATIYRAIQQLTKLATVQAMSGCAACAAGNLPLARRYLLEALQMASGWPDWSVGIQILALAVPLLAADEEVERAVEVYAAVLRYPYIANSRWYQQVVDQPLAAKTAALAAEVRQEAKVRGESQPWQRVVSELLMNLTAINIQPGDNPDATLPALHAPTII